MPSPTNSVSANAVSLRTISSFSSGLFSAMNLTDAHQVGQVSDFRLAVAGQEHHAVDAMSRPKMTDERRTFATRRVAKAVGRGVTIVDQDDALESAGWRRQTSGSVWLCGAEVPCGW